MSLGGHWIIARCTLQFLFYLFFLVMGGGWGGVARAWKNKKNLTEKFKPYSNWIHHTR